MQAILNASAMHDEFVKELLVSYGKVTATALYTLYDAKILVAFRQKSSKKVSCISLFLPLSRYLFWSMK